MTELTVNRQRSRAGFTPGELLWNGEHECFTCEDQIREIPGEPVETWKIRNETAIPAGRYQVTITWSPHFLKPMPLVMGVPGFSGVRIHVGNTALDTDGCLLVGDVQTETGIGASGAEFARFIPKLAAALDEGEVWITYNNPANAVGAAS